MSEFNKDLISLQGEIANPGFDKVNPMYKSKYTSLATVLDHARKICTKHNFAVVQTVQSDVAPHGAAYVQVTTLLQHVGGTSFNAGTITLYPSKGDVHGIVGASTYARRLGILSALSIAGDEDDDGNSAVAHPPKPKAEPTVVDGTGAWDKLSGSKTYDEFKAAWKSLTTPERAWLNANKTSELADLGASLKPKAA